jgi:Fur family ferric uptake transcriptional regulator
VATEPASEALERFRRWLRDRHLPVTQQRDLVAQVLLASDSQLSVDELAARLRDRRTPVGLATIYRALDTMVEAGFVRAHDFGEGFRRYEPLRPGQQHGFMVCGRCGRVSEFPLERLDRVLSLLADEHEFLTERHRVELHGTCGDCRRREMGAIARAGRPR